MTARIRGVLDRFVSRSVFSLTASIVMAAFPAVRADDCDGNGIDDRLDLEAGFALSEALEIGPGSIDLSTGDLDGDGDLDAAFAHNARASGFLAVSLLRNEGGEFEPWRVFELDVASVGGVAAGDVDGDGESDIVVLVSTQESASREVLLPLLNRGGAFEATSEIEVSPAPNSERVLAAGDIQGDGAAELVVSGESTPGIVLFVNDGRGGFERREAASSDAVELSFLDLDADGHTDLLSVGDSFTVL